MNNQEKTLKVPFVVHRALKQLAAARNVSIYVLLAQLLLAEIAGRQNPSFDARIENDAYYYWYEGTSQMP